MIVEINSRAEYDYVVNRGYCPLIDWRYFTLDIFLRIDLQHELFGTADFTRANERFYRYVWENSMHVCQETGQPLYNYSSVHVSHIISKGADRRMAIDPRNANLLTYKQHNNWEYGKRKHMNIWPINRIVMNMLKKEYNILSK